MRRILIEAAWPQRHRPVHELDELVEHRLIVVELGNTLYLVDDAIEQLASALR